MKWLLGIDEMKKNIGKKSGKEQAQILNATMEETDKLIHNMKTKMPWKSFMTIHRT